MRRWALVLVLVLGVAHADGRRPWIEVAAGGSIPLGLSDEWVKRFDASAEFSVRGGVTLARARRRLGLGGELSFTPLHTTPANLAFGSEDRWSMYRLRLGPSARAGVQVGPALFYGQIGFAVDLFFGSFTQGVSGTTCDMHSFGLAALPAVGVRDPDQHIGVELAAPIAVHRRGDLCFDANYTSLDVDILATLSF
jgi:hypothetical protein